MVHLSTAYALAVLSAGAAVLGFWGLGRVSLRVVARDLPEDGLTFLLSYGLGAWITWMAILLLGLAGGYQPWVVRVLFALSAAAGAAELRRVRPQPRKWIARWLAHESRYEQALMLLCGAIVALALLGALTPPAAQDALVHHLVVPKAFIKAQRFMELPYNYFSYFPAGMEILFLYGLLVSGPGMATLLHLSFGLATVVAILTGGRLIGLPLRGRLLAATAFVSVPTVWMEMTWAYVDLALTFYVTLMVLAALRFRQSGNVCWLYLSGFALGAALSIKYTAFVFVPMFAAFVFPAIRGGAAGRTALLARRLAAALAIALLVSSPWFVRNTIWTGNPLFPFLLDLIPSHNPGWDPGRGQLVVRALRRYGGEGKTLVDYLLLPVKLSFLARYEHAERYDGVLGPFYLLSIPLLAAARGLGREARWLLGFAAAFFLFWALSSQQVRYLLPVLPALALAIAAADRWMAAKTSAASSSVWRRLHAVGLFVVMAIFLVNSGVIVYYFNRFNYAQVFFGRITAAEYLRNKFDYYRFYEHINEHTPPDSRVFLVLASNQPYYLERDYFSDSVFEDYTLDRLVAAAHTPRDVFTRLRGMGLTHILVRSYILFGPRTTPFNEHEKALFLAFLEHHCQPLLLDQHFALFELAP